MFGCASESTSASPSLGQPTIGVLTSGGDCPGLNAVIAGVVKCGLQLGYGIVGFRQGYEGLVPIDPNGTANFVRLSTADVEGIFRCGGTILGSTNQGRFVAVRDECTRVDLDPQLLAGVQRTVDQMGLVGLVCIGGDGSLAVALQFDEVGIPVVGVPKTIDNDLSATAFTFGFDSAVACATEAIDRLQTTADSHGRVMVLEVMGRHAGWIALHAGIAGGADAILLPEIEWSYEGLIGHLRNRTASGRRSAIIVVAEGATLPEGGHVLSERRREDRQTRLGGVGHVVAAEIADQTGAETRATVLGHLQRGGSPTAFDRLLASQFGVHAVHLIQARKFGRMVCYQPPAVSDVAIAEATGRLNQVQRSSAAIVTATGLGMYVGDGQIWAGDNSPCATTEMVTEAPTRFATPFPDAWMLTDVPRSAF